MATRRLKFDEKLALVDALREQADRIRQERPTYVALAKEMSARFGIPIRDHTIADTCQKIGLEWQPKPAAGTGGALMAMRQRLERLESLESRVARLERELGVGASAGLFPEAGPATAAPVSA